MKQFSSVVLGGTFDVLHKGHVTLLSKAFEIGDHVTIGLTSDTYVKEMKDKGYMMNDERVKIQSYTKRYEQLYLWLKTQGYCDRTTIVSIDDMYGPTTNRGPHFAKASWGRQRMRDFDAIVVSTETKKGAETINKRRMSLGLPLLTIVEIPMIPAEDGKIISGSRIRLDQIDTAGKLVLPVIMRVNLGKPIGRVLDAFEVSRAIKADKDAICITVGDKTTMRALHEGLAPQLAIIDLFVERKPVVWDKGQFDQLTSCEVKNIKSGPGFISGDAMEAIRIWAENPKKRMTLLIDGEEDLLVLPAIIYAPIGAILYYGQPAFAKAPAGKPAFISDDSLNRGKLVGGLVRVEITEEKKQEAKTLLSVFTPETKKP